MFLLPATTPSRIIAVPSDLIPLAGDGNSAIFLAQVLFWWNLKGRQRFYKFNAPCDHALYRPGDSWQEELGLKRTMFMTARRRVAVKVRISCKAEVQQAFGAGALVVYGTDEHHLTWYMVNEAALRQQAPAQYVRLFGAESGADGATVPAPHAPPSTLSHAKKLPPAPASTASADAEGLHSLMQASCTGNNTEKTSQKASESAQARCISHPRACDATLPAGGGAGKGHAPPVESAILTALQARGVQAASARLIARRARRAGWDVAQTLAVFDAHRLDAKQAGARSPLGVAVTRLVKGEQMRLPPAATLARVQWLHQAHGGEGGQAAGDIRADGLSGEEASAAEPTPLKRLWQQVLGDIQVQVTRATFERHFRGTWLEARGGAYVVCSHDPYTPEWLARRLHPLIAATLARWAGGAVQPRFICQ